MPAEIDRMGGKQMSSDKTFYTIQSKTIEKIETALHHEQLHVITAEAAIRQIREAVVQMEDEVLAAVTHVKGERK